MVEVAHDVLHRAAELKDIAVLEFVLSARHPFVKCRLRRAFDALVRHHAVADVHQEIAVDGCLYRVDHHLAAERERIGLLRESAHGKDGDVRESRVAQRLSEDAEVVRRAACTAGLKERDARVVGIAHPRLERGDELSDDDDRGIAHVVVDVAQSHVDRRFVRHRRDDDVVAVLAHGRLEQVEMDRRHLRGEDGVRLFAVLGKAWALDDGRLVVNGRLAACERGDERAQTNPRRAEVRHLVELNHRVDALVRLEDLAHLACGECVESAAERTELDERDVRMLRDELRRMVETRVVAPLVDDLQASFLHGDMVDGVLGEDGQFVRLYHLGDAVVDLRIDMIGTPREKDGVLARLLDAVENPLSVVAHILPVLRDLCVAGIHGGGDLFLADALDFSELLGQTLDHALAVVDRKERLEEADILLAQDVHVAANILGVGRNDRAVEVVCPAAGLVVHIVRLAGVEYRRDALFDEIDDVPVRELCGVAERVRRDRRHALIKELG